MIRCYLFLFLQGFLFPQTLCNSNFTLHHHNESSPVNLQKPSFLKQLSLTNLCKQELEKVRIMLIDDRRPHHQTIKSYRAYLMQTAVCFHSYNRIQEALQLYNYLRKEFPNYAFPLVNIAFIELKKSKPNNVIGYLNTYFKEVGGMYGNETKNNRMKDIDAQMIGSPCRAHALHTMECVNALNFYGIAQVETYNYDKALESYHRAIEIGKDDVSFVTDVYQNLGDLYNTIGLFDEAGAALLKAFWSSFKFHKRGMNPDSEFNPTPLIQRAMLVPSIQSSLEKSMDFVKKFESRIHDLMQLIDHGGVGWQNDDSDLFMLERGVSQIEDIRSIKPLVGSYNFLEKRLQVPHFYLHYYGLHDRPIQQHVMQMFEKISQPALLGLTMFKNYRYPSIILSEVAPSIPSVIYNHDKEVDKSNRKKLRIIFISSHFGGNEPHGLLMIDMIRKLPTNFFECVAIGIGTKSPSESFIDALNGNYHGIGTNGHAARDLISSLNPDCLIFGEVLNEGTLFTLAQTRFAPIQILVMGAPVTSGFSNTIDYFISGDRLEHPYRTQMSGDQSNLEHYTEQVVLFDGQGISFPLSEPHPLQSSKLAKGDAVQPLSAGYQDSVQYERRLYDEITGMPTGITGPIYLCFQNLFKIHPTFDMVLIRILQMDKLGHVVLQAARSLDKTMTTLERLRKTVVRELCFGDVGKEETSPICKEANSVLHRIHFIPRVKSDKMKFIFDQATVMLHPFPFGGSKTASDALKSGVPLVTFPQPYLRGRLASTFYTTMALHEIDKEVASSLCCVATDEIDYIQKALNLGQDKSYRQKVSRAIMLQNYRIFDDSQTSFEWARFLTRALGVIIDDVTLAKEMKYHPKPWQEDKILQGEFVTMQQRWKRSRIIRHFQLGSSTD